MPAFRTSGSTGQAPTTSWMGAIPDRGFSLLQPAHYNSAGNFVQVDSLGPANYINLWTPHNTFVETGSGTNAPTVSVGATVTAPDGTSSGTASHIVEAANTGFHAMVAYSQLAQTANPGGWSLRLATIAKPAERTRIALTLSIMGTSAPGLSGSGCRTIFDLAGVQIGVANTTFNVFNGSFFTPDLIAGPATISPLGNGWCLCMMDLIVTLGQNAFGQVWGGFSIDAGSGTNAPNLSYLGDVTKGVYAWRTSLLPPAAWAMSGATVFHDDFDDISTIDVNNTKAPGYKWYTNNLFPGAGWGPADFDNAPTPSSQISVSGSQLTLQQWPGHFFQVQMMPAASLTDHTPGGGYVGQAFTLPQMVEIRWKKDPINSGSDFPFFWDISIDGLGIFGTFPPCINYEFDGPSSIDHGVLSFWTYPDGVPPGPGFALGVYGSYGDAQGYVPWVSTYNYSGNNNERALYAGQVYKNFSSLPGTNVGNQPDISPAFWTQIIPYPITNPSSYDSFSHSDFNVFTKIILPTPHNDAGWVLSFFNGVPVNGTPQAGFSGPSGMPFSPTTQHNSSTSAFVQRWNLGLYVPVLFAGGGTGDPAVVDYVTISQ